ncbi:MAG: transcription antitermination factor NusB [Thermotogota bacterium]|nr:transcription antitermination factor NusB [Thermotogota bacterium]
MTDPRTLAVESLTYVEKNGKFPTKKIELALKTLSSENKKFCTFLIMETLRKRLLIDKVLSELLNWPENIPKFIRNVLRVGVTQLLFMDTVPGYAAVSEMVELVQVKKFRGLVNAVLREVNRKSFEFENLPIYLQYAHPKWLYEYMLKHPYIDYVESLLMFNQNPPMHAVSPDCKNILDSEGYIYSESDYSDCFLVIEKPENAANTEHVDELKYILEQMFDIPIINPITTELGRINEKPWLLHSLTESDFIKSKKQIISYLKEKTLPECFIYFSDTLSLEENTDVAKELNNYKSVNLEERLKKRNIESRYGGYGNWLVLPETPRPAYISYLKRSD